jgi:MFS superfamily sulfate permease-like transporter
MKHIMLGFVLLILVPLVYKIQLLKSIKPYENKLGVVVFSLAGFMQVFIGLCKLGSEDIYISDQTATGILVGAAVIWCTCLYFAFRNSGKETKNF